MSSDRLALTQSAVLHFMRNFQQRNGSMPTRVDIAAHFDWRSPHAAECHVQAIRSRGFIETVPGRARGLTFTQRAWDLFGESLPQQHAAPTMLALPVVNPTLVLLAAQRQRGAVA